jgi:hypothetical protein
MTVLSVAMLFENQIRINVYHVLTVQGNAVSSLVSSANSFREKPSQNAEIHVNRLELPTVELQVSCSQTILICVKFGESAFIKRNPKVLPSQVPETSPLKILRKSLHTKASTKVAKKEEL